MTRWLRGRLMIDRLLAAIASVLLAPLVAILAVLIRRQDDGPAFIRVERVGRNGRPFRMWKLRSMRAARADGTAGGSVLTGGVDDDRITPLGRRLRSYHLDELPQLWNVVRGDMALLGPRPEDEKYVRFDDPRWRSVLSVPPGIAGPTQVIVSDWEREVLADDPSGTAYSTDVLPTKLAIDDWYVRHASPATDVLTAGTLVRRLLPSTESWTLKRRVFHDVPDAAPAHAFLRAQEAGRLLARSGTSSSKTDGVPRRISNYVAKALDDRVARHSRNHDLVSMRPSRDPRAFAAELDGNTTLFTEADGAYRSLTELEATVWDRCDGNRTVGELAALIADDWDEEAPSTLRDVAFTVLGFVADGVLVEERNEFVEVSTNAPQDAAVKPTRLPTHVYSIMGATLATNRRTSRTTWR